MLRANIYVCRESESKLKKFPILDVCDDDNLCKGVLNVF